MNDLVTHLKTIHYPHYFIIEKKEDGEWYVAITKWWRCFMPFTSYQNNFRPMTKEEVDMYEEYMKVSHSLRFKWYQYFFMAGIFFLPPKTIDIWSAGNEIYRWRAIFGGVCFLLLFVTFFYNFYTLPFPPLFKKLKGDL